jgi:hypothetical protein
MNDKMPSKFHRNIFKQAWQRLFDHLVSACDECQPEQARFCAVAQPIVSGMWRAAFSRLTDDLRKYAKQNRETC